MSYGSTCACRQYPVFCGLVTSPCHALVDTGAQDGVIGLWSWQRWVVCLALCCGLRPVYQQIAQDSQARGVGGPAKLLMLATMPTGIAGANGLTKWCILDEPTPVDLENVGTPPLLPISLLKF